MHNGDLLATKMWFTKKNQSNSLFAVHVPDNLFALTLAVYFIITAGRTKHNLNCNLSLKWIFCNCRIPKKLMFKTAPSLWRGRTRSECSHPPTSGTGLRTARTRTRSIWTRRGRRIGGFGWNNAEFVSTSTRENWLSPGASVGDGALWN